MQGIILAKPLRSLSKRSAVKLNLASNQSSLPLSLLAALLLSAVPSSADEASQAREDAEGQFQLARALLRGEGVPKDPSRAFELMQKAADKGHADAIGGIGYFYAAGVVVSKDANAAAEWFRKGAEKGSAKAQLNLGLALARGAGVEKDENAGLQMIDQAAASGLPEAAYAQGETYYWGQFGREIDYAKAREAFEKSARAGNAAGENNLGVILRDGLGVEKDEPAALKLFRMAAEKGNSRAQSNLGHTLGVNTQDRTKRIEALKWLILAADAKEITAQKTMEELSLTMPGMSSQKHENWRTSSGRNRNRSALPRGTGRPLS
jgi:TPR repeat protein